MEPRPEVKMPELMVFARAFVFGIVCTEVFRIAFYIGNSLTTTLSELAWLYQVLLIVVCLVVVCIYIWRRDAYASAARLLKSLRVDLLITVLIGVWSNVIIQPWLAVSHKFLKQAFAQSAPAIVVLLLVLLLSPLFSAYWPRKKRPQPQLYFLEDEEIKRPDEDVFASNVQAKSFADAVLASGAHSGLVFGVDGPWGVGKTSFINLAQLHWAKVAGDTPIVFRFEPLRYASEPDLSQRFIKELSAAIQKQVFVPEFKPVVTRYSRMLKGKAEFSFFGMKLSFEPTDETIDDMLEDVDDVLKRIGRRIIVVIDDLDRLEAKAVNNVLFTVRRTYILCYDTENLVGTADDKENAREFLEKFVMVKLSLFVDSSAIKNYLERDWSGEETPLLTVPSDSMLKLTSVLGELGEMLGSELAAKYMPLLGDLRKVKRFVNAVLLMQIERTNLGRTDFSRRDLLNLMLLHLNYPGLFRHIYVEETEGRSGIFHVRRSSENSEFSNSEEFASIWLEQEPNAKFLLGQLFDVTELKLDGATRIEEAALRSRACFNQSRNRNLEGYLKLIVRFVTPEPRATFALYQDAVRRVREGAAIKTVLEGKDFRLTDDERAHDQFWSVFVNQSHDIKSSTAEDAISTLVDYLPQYSSVDVSDRALRSRSIYALLRLLDRAGWGRTNGRRLPNSPHNILEIAHRIFGEEKYEGNGLIRQLAAIDRGVLGWNDLMLFRLQCSADRAGQLFNLHNALILHQDVNAPTTGSTRDLALYGMRHLSQEVFELFRSVFIAPSRNFLAEVDMTSSADFLGGRTAHLREENVSDDVAGHLTMEDRLAATRSLVKSFVIYQLANSLGPTGSGVGCGFYDQRGKGDSSGIGQLMNDYVFDVCFNPNVEEDNIYHFANHCLSHLSSGFFSGEYEDGYVPTKRDLPGGLNIERLIEYWEVHRERIMKLDLPNTMRRVVTLNYIASYKEELPKVFDLLDELVGE